MLADCTSAKLLFQIVFVYPYNFIGPLQIR